MVAVPGAMPVMMPVVIPAVAMPVIPLAQLPPAIEAESRVLVPVQTPLAPVMDGAGFTVMVRMAEQPAEPTE